MSKKKPENWEELMEVFKQMKAFQKPRTYVAHNIINGKDSWRVDMINSKQKARMLKLKKIELGEYDTKEEAEAYCNQWEKDNPRTEWEDFQ